MKKLINTYKDKKVVVTGHSGFKGSWLSIWLHLLGAEVLGISDKIISKPSHYSSAQLEKIIKTSWIDITDTNRIVKTISKFNPDIIFHLAAQPLVYSSFQNPVDTYKINSIGTTNILESIRCLQKRVVGVMITSDKVYENFEWTWGYRENDIIGGKDPYSASKGMAELAIKGYVDSFFNSSGNNKIIGVARAGNVIGGGDWAANRIVPDCVKAWSKGNVVNIRNPNSTRPWQHVLEPLSGYLSLGRFLSKKKSQDGTAYNFGPHADQDNSVANLINEMSKNWKNVKWKNTFVKKSNIKESGLLKLNCDKSLSALNWKPVLSFEETVSMTTKWYKNYYDNKSKTTLEFSKLQLEEYINLAKKRKVDWAQ